MHITVLYQNQVVSLAIVCTALGREALNQHLLTPRERQLLLLLDKNSNTSEQVVAHLLQKINIPKLSEQGLIKYQIDASTDKMVNQFPHSSLVQLNFNTPSYQKYDKTENKDLKNFLATYSHLHDDEIINVIEVNESPTVKEQINHSESTPTIEFNAPPIKMPQAVPTHFEDIMIVQTLLNQS
ncbi:MULTISPECIES: hypothetical protein [unclassified Moraxella]|uniref:hypothetical protein n=1 Tax=unclassified Moraxella TaxID=2685852 RepID=UPI003AF6BB05